MSKPSRIDWKALDEAEQNLPPYSIVSSSLLNGPTDTPWCAPSKVFHTIYVVNFNPPPLQFTIDAGIGQ